MIERAKMKAALRRDVKEGTLRSLIRMYAARRDFWRAFWKQASKHGAVGIGRHGVNEAADACIVARICESRWENCIDPEDMFVLQRAFPEANLNELTKEAFRIAADTLFVAARGGRST